MTPEDLARVAEWERLAEAATSGPWGADVTHTPGGSFVETIRNLVDGQPLGEFALAGADGQLIAAARTAVPEMARMLREALDGLATVGEQREKWREVAAAWEERAHAAMRLADVAAAELKRMRDTHPVKSVEEVVAQQYERRAAEPLYAPTDERLMNDATAYALVSNQATAAQAADVYAAKCDDLMSRLREMVEKSAPPIVLEVREVKS